MHFHASLNPNLFSFLPFNIFCHSETLNLFWVFACVCLYVLYIHYSSPTTTNHHLPFFLATLLTLLIYKAWLNWTEQKDPLNTFCIETLKQAMLLLPPPHKTKQNSILFNFQLSSSRRTDLLTQFLQHRWASILLTMLIV